MSQLDTLRSAWGSTTAVFSEHLVPTGDVDLGEGALQGLLGELPPKQLVLRRSADSPGGDMQRSERATSEPLFEQLRTQCMHAMALDLQDVDPGFRALLERFVDTVRPVLEERGQRIVHGMIGLFLSSPGSIARYHADPEHNFLFQVRGSKTVHLFPGEAPHFPPEAKERLFCDRVHYIDYADSFAPAAEQLDLRVGMASYQPMLRPHWVRCHDELSLSIGFSLYTDDAERQGHVHRFNRRLRRMGLHPSPPGTGPVRDSVKAIVVRSLSRPVRP